MNDTPIERIAHLVDLGPSGSLEAGEKPVTPTAAFTAARIVGALDAGSVSIFTDYEGGVRLRRKSGPLRVTVEVAGDGVISGAVVNMDAEMVLTHSGLSIATAVHLLVDA